MSRAFFIRQPLVCLGVGCYLVLVMTGCGMETGAAPFTVNPHRVDPYKNFKFRVKWDNQYVAGISKISPVKRMTEVHRHRSGGDMNSSHLAPGTTTFAPIILERGRTHDTVFEEWANLVWGMGGSNGTEMSLKNFRKDIMIELRNEAGSVALAFHGYRCWPSDYVPIGQLTSTGDSSVAVESLTLQCEGWERDLDILEPLEN